MRQRLLICLFAGALWAADPALTIYNQNFAVVRGTVPLNLQKGENHITYSDITGHLEPQSVILRDVTGRVPLRVLEQNYRADPVTAEMLLSYFEGKTIDFLVQGDKPEIVRGKIIRSGYSPVVYNNNGYYPPPLTPIIEVDGKLRFTLPGLPLFPALGDDTILKPTIQWTVASDRDARLDAELAYVSRGMTWSADYNVIAAPGRTGVDLIGWVSMQNDSGKTFENARIKLMAGEVNKVEPQRLQRRRDGVMAGIAGGMPMGPPVTEKTFDEYHLYTLERPATLHDKETKQVEFLRAHQVVSQQIYIYDGLKLDPNQYQGWNMDMIRNNPEYGTSSNNKVWAMQEFKNSDANHLGMPLPAGRVRFYRQDTDGQLEFTGENEIPHTPKDETVRLYTGSAFDLTGERKRTNYQIDMGRREIDESFEIKVRNHKKQAMEIRVVEHLYRGLTWEVRQPSVPFAKTDSQTIEYRVTLAPDEEKSVTYNAHYRW